MIYRLCLLAKKSSLPEKPRATVNIEDQEKLGSVRSVQLRHMLSKWHCTTTSKHPIVLCLIVGVNSFL